MMKQHGAGAGVITLPGHGTYGRSGRISTRRPSRDESLASRCGGVGIAPARTRPRFSSTLRSTRCAPPGRGSLTGSRRGAERAPSQPHTTLLMRRGDTRARSDENVEKLSKFRHL